MRIEPGVAGGAALPHECAHEVASELVRQHFVGGVVVARNAGRPAVARVVDARDRAARGCTDGRFAETGDGDDFAGHLAGASCPVVLKASFAGHRHIVKQGQPGRVAHALGRELTFRAERPAVGVGDHVVVVGGEKLRGRVGRCRLSDCPGVAVDGVDRDNRIVSGDFAAGDPALVEFGVLEGARLTVFGEHVRRVVEKFVFVAEGAVHVALPAEPRPHQSDIAGAVEGGVFGAGDFGEQVRHLFGRRDKLSVRFERLERNARDDEVGTAVVPAAGVGVEILQIGGGGVVGVVGAPWIELGDAVDRHQIEARVESVDRQVHIGAGLAAHRRNRVGEVHRLAGLVVDAFAVRVEPVVLGVERHGVDPAAAENEIRKPQRVAVLAQILVNRLGGIARRAVRRRRIVGVFGVDR